MPEKHKYWGPLPGESPELYKALGAETLQRTILDQIPNFWRGEFNMEAGRDLGVHVSPEKIMPPAELTRQARLERLIDFTKRNEAIHLTALGALGVVSAVSAIEGGSTGTGVAIAFGAINAVVNIPPIIVQRYNRLRAYRVLDKITGHAKNSTA